MKIAELVSLWDQCLCGKITAVPNCFTFISRVFLKKEQMKIFLKNVFDLSLIRQNVVN